MLVRECKDVKDFTPVTTTLTHKAKTIGELLVNPESQNCPVLSNNNSSVCVILVITRKRA